MKRIPALYDTFDDLFFAPKGLIDITAAMPGEAAWFNQEGGIFTDALSTLFLIEKQVMDLDGDGVVDWNEAYGKLKQMTQQRFDVSKNRAAAGTPLTKAKGQTPAYYHLATWPKNE